MNDDKRKCFRSYAITSWKALAVFGFLLLLVLVLLLIYRHLPPTSAPRILVYTEVGLSLLLVAGLCILLFRPFRQLLESYLPGHIRKDIKEEDRKMDFGWLGSTLVTAFVCFSAVTAFMLTSVTSEWIMGSTVEWSAFFKYLFVISILLFWFFLNLLLLIGILRYTMPRLVLNIAASSDDGIVSLLKNLQVRLNEPGEANIMRTSFHDLGNEMSQLFLRMKGELSTHPVIVPAFKDMAELASMSESAVEAHEDVAILGGHFRFSAGEGSALEKLFKPLSKVLNKSVESTQVFVLSSHQHFFSALLTAHILQNITNAERIAPPKRFYVVSTPFPLYSGIFITRNGFLLFPISSLDSYVNANHFFYLNFFRPDGDGYKSVAHGINAHMRTLIADCIDPHHPAEIRPVTVLSWLLLNPKSAVRGEYQRRLASWQPPERPSDLTWEWFLEHFFEEDFNPDGLKCTYEGTIKVGLEGGLADRDWSAELRSVVSPPDTPALTAAESDILKKLGFMS